MKKAIEYLRNHAVWNGKVRSTAGVEASILNNPTEVLGGHKSFLTPLTELIIHEMTTIANDSFGAVLNESSKDGVRQHILGTDILVVLHTQDKILGFSSGKNLNANGQDIYWAHGIALSSTFKGSGYAIDLNLLLLAMRNSNIVAFTTQNPVAYCLMERSCQPMYPSITTPIVPAQYRSIGKALLNAGAGKLNPETFVVSNLYDKCLYKKIPTCKFAGVNNWFERSLCIKNGQSNNGFLVIADASRVSTDLGPCKYDILLQ